MDTHNLTLSRGGYEDYLALERFHYRASAPATRTRILSARINSSGQGILAGVLVVSMPTLNGRWRDVAWAGQRPKDRLGSAAWINREVRCISRVIVDPRFRGQSIARRLVEAYLRDPDSPRTEAIAAMGAFCPFFVAAGMREVRVPPTARDRALELDLRHHGLEPWRCADLSHVRGRVRRSGPLQRAITRWARASRATSRWCQRDENDMERLAELACLGGSAIVQPPRVFVTP